MAVCTSRASVGLQSQWYGWEINTSGLLILSVLQNVWRERNGAGVWVWSMGYGGRDVKVGDRETSERCEGRGQRNKYMVEVHHRGEGR